MRAVAIVLAAATLAVSRGSGATPDPCQLSQGLSQQRAAAVEARKQSNGKQGNAGSVQATDGPLLEIDRQYSAFFASLGAAAKSGDPAALPACCQAASADRLGALSCDLVKYVAGGRRAGPDFLSAVPGGKDLADLWQLEQAASAASRSGASLPGPFLPNGPVAAYLGELFMLVLDGREEAIAKYFRLAEDLPKASAPLVDKQITLLFRESPSVLVMNWFLIRKHRETLRPAARAIREQSKPAEFTQILRAIRDLRPKNDPDCEEIVRLFGK